MKKTLFATICILITNLGYTQYNENENWNINKSHISDLNLKGKVKEIREYAVKDYNLYSEESIQSKYLSISPKTIIKSIKEDSHFKKIKLNHRLFFNSEGFLAEYKNYVQDLENYSVKNYYSNSLIDSTTSGNWTNKDFKQIKKKDTTILSCLYGDYFFTENRILHKVIDRGTKELKKEITYTKDGKTDIIRESIGEKKYTTFFKYDNENKVTEETFLIDVLQNIKNHNKFGDITSVERHNHSTLNILNARFFYKYDEKNNWIIKIDRHNQRNHKITIRFIDYY